jgi:hypothetical protein
MIKEIEELYDKTMKSRKPAEDSKAADEAKKDEEKKALGAQDSARSHQTSGPNSARLNENDLLSL